LLFEEVSETLYVLGELRPVRAGLIVRRNAVTFAAGALVKVSSATGMPSVAARGNKARVSHNALIFCFQFLRYLTADSVTPPFEVKADMHPHKVSIAGSDE
jgi:hypothetical protein